jgi:hypothetical protein
MMVGGTGLDSSARLIVVAEAGAPKAGPFDVTCTPAAEDHVRERDQQRQPRRQPNRRPRAHPAWQRSHRAVSETLGSHYISSSGGQADFMRGAALSDGGRSFIVTHATAVNGTISRIQPMLTPGAIVTTHKNLVDQVVTAYGVAELRGRTIRQRAAALIAIAAPAFRDELRGAAKRLGYL